MLLNADLGEGFDDVDRNIMPYIDQANVACGGHTGNSESVARAVSLASSQSVRIGAHPSYPDKEQFGRRSILIDLHHLEHELITQIALVADTCRQQQTRLSHIKAHGALYNDSNFEADKMRLLLRLAKAFDCDLMIQSLPDLSATRREARQMNVRLITEGFADRAYTSSGQLAARSIPGAVFEDAQAIYAQASKFMHQKHISCIDNASGLNIKADSLCVHGDNPASLQAVIKIRNALNRNR